MSQDDAHALAMQMHRPYQNYDPEVIAAFPEYSNSNWRMCPATLGHFWWGLPDEFADPVLPTSAVELTGWQHGAGTLAAGSAAYDEMDSSAMGFRTAAGLLAAAVAAGRDGKSLIEAAVAQTVDRW